MNWKINYYNEKVEKEVFALPDTLLSKYLKLTDLMEVYGANLGEPHTKSIGNGLFELRLKGKEGIARVFYCTRIGKTIYMLHCFIKKSQKIPKKELKLAQDRMKEVMKK